MEKITKEELIQKYGEVELKFHSYYKYCFNYKAEVKGVEFYGTFGGSSDDIYRYEVGPDKVIKVKDFEASLHSLSVNKEGLIFDYSDFN